MPSRAAVFLCPCCAGSASVLLGPGQRPPRRRPCPNGGCWACLGACKAMAGRAEVVKVPDRLEPVAEAPVPASRPRPTVTSRLLSPNLVQGLPGLA